MDDITGPNPITPLSVVGNCQNDIETFKRTRFVDYVQDTNDSVLARQPISLDFTAFQKKIESSLIADVRKMDGGISPRELYIKSNPNLLHHDYTNPRDWYNSDVRKKLIKTVSFNSNTNNIGAGRQAHAYQNETKLPRINTQERIRGTKSADDKVSKSEHQYQTLLRRGPSFDEAKLLKTPHISVSDKSIPPPLRKTISWPRSRRDRRLKKHSTLQKYSKSEDNKLSLPPLDPGMGRPFLPHLPPHQPWISSKASSNNITKGKLKLTQNSSKDVNCYLDEESKFQEKIDKWFQDIPTDNVEHQECFEATQRLIITSGNTLLPKHHIYKGQLTDVLLDRGKVIVPYLKEPIQYDPVFNELRIQRNGKFGDTFEINREEYKLKQKSSLQLKMTEPLMNCGSSNNFTYSTKQVTLDVDLKQSDYKSKQPDKRLDQSKAKNSLPNARPRIADRKTGMNFLLAKVDEGDDGYSEYTYEEEADIAINGANENTAGDLSNDIVHTCTTEAPLFSEAKTSVINLVLSNLRPAERQPHHIEMSLRKLAESEQKKMAIYDPCKSEKEADIFNGNASKTADECLGNGIMDALEGPSTEKILSAFVNDKVCKDNANVLSHHEFKNHDNSMNDPQTAAVQESHSVPQGNVDGFPLDASNGLFHPDGNTAHAKSNKAALTKYNVLEPFRDGSQPNIVLPKGLLPVVKPACREWTHPPTYKLDIKNCEVSGENGPRTKVADLSLKTNTGNETGFS